MDNVDKKLAEVKEKVLACRRCFLCKTRKLPVVGQGNHKAKIMFVGEAPGRQEDLKGRPFCGAAGKILDQLLETVNLKREEIYITNILKCRPPGNRDPKEKEIKACTPYLEEQIKIIKPKVVCSLGRWSARFLMGKFGLQKELKPISLLHGKIFWAKANDEKIAVIPFFHPAVAVYNQNMKPILEKDFQILKMFK